MSKGRCFVLGLFQSRGTIPPSISARRTAVRGTCVLCKTVGIKNGQISNGVVNMSSNNSIETEQEYAKLVSHLIDLLRQIRLGPIEAIANSSDRGNLANASEACWSEVHSIGRRLMDLGGLDLMHRAVREVRHFSAGMCDGLERSWEICVPGYKKIKWLP